VRAIQEQLTISERRACRIAKCNRRVFEYKSVRVTDDGLLRKRLEELAAERRRFGYRRLAALLRREGVIVNLKRIAASMARQICRCDAEFDGGSRWAEAIPRQPSAR